MLHVPIGKKKNTENSLDCRMQVEQPDILEDKETHKLTINVVAGKGGTVRGCRRQSKRNKRTGKAFEGDRGS